MSEGMRKVEVLRAACCVAGVDGEVTAAERRILEMLAREVGVGVASLSAMIERAETDKDFYAEQFQVLKSEPKETMQLLFSVAVADGQLRTFERQVLERLASRLDVTRERFDQWLAQAIRFLQKNNASSGET